MFKKFVVLLASLGLIFQLSGCTSKDSKDDAGEEMAIDGTESTDTTADVEKVEGEQNLDIAADDSSLSADSLPEEALGESTASSDAPKDAGSQDLAAQDPAASPPLDVAIDPTLEPTDALPPDTLGEGSSSVAEAAPPVAAPAEEPVMTEAPTSSVAASTKEDTPKAESKPLPSYRKVDQTPWKEGGKLLNTVYVARAGDTWASVNKSIYGNGKTASLKKMNPAIKSRALKVGDKVYYNSPHRPDDETKVITFYEDTGLAPEVYIAKSGDDLKAVAKNLLGSKENWKELYATNDFESKGALDEGTQIKYWKSAPAPVKDVASNASASTHEMAPSQPTQEMPPAADPAMDAAAMGQVPPPPAMPPNPDPGMAPPAAQPPGAHDVAAGGPPPPPDMNAPPPPPPPDMAQMEPPPPPPPPPAAPAPPAPHEGGPAKAAGTEEAANPMEEDQMTTLAAGAVLAVGLALFMIMRRRRKKELEQAIQDTHVG